LYRIVHRGEVNWILEVDIVSFLDASSHYTPSVGWTPKRPGRASGT
jgi:hypothetical protein